MLRTSQPAAVQPSAAPISSAEKASGARHKADAVPTAAEGAALAAATLPAAPTDPGVLRPIGAKQMLEHCFLRYEAARRHWEQGDLARAHEEVDLAFRMLTLVPTELESEDAQRQDELQLLLSRLLVTMSAAHADPIRGMSEMPLVMNSYVEREIRSFQTSERHFFVESYRRSGRYVPHIIQRLEAHRMPVELAWLPLIESGYNNRALSPARALGLWQFIPSTGYRFGLHRDVWVDERMDPEKATEAAIQYLKRLHELFGDWSTAIAAYNCGEANVGRAIRRQRAGYLDSFWDLFPVLPYETARYVPRFMATLHIVRDPKKYGFDDLGPPYAPIPFENAEISRQTDLRSLARLLDVDAEMLRSLNPSLRQEVTPPRSFPLRVPAGYAAVLAAKLTTTDDRQLLSATHRNAVNPEMPNPRQYRVRRGDTLSGIARRFRISVASIVKANSLSSQHSLKIGQILSIPRRGT